jgi:hypothetical protein
MVPALQTLDTSLKEVNSRVNWAMEQTDLKISGLHSSVGPDPLEVGDLEPAQPPGGHRGKHHQDQGYCGIHKLKTLDVGSGSSRKVHHHVRSSAGRTREKRKRRKMKGQRCRLPEILMTSTRRRSIKMSRLPRETRLESLLS